MYVSKKRVIRDGYLVAYAGEEMSDDEARARGLVDIEEPKPKRATRRRKAVEAEREEEGVER